MIGAIFSHPWHWFPWWISHPDYFHRCSATWPELPHQWFPGGNSVLVKLQTGFLLKVPLTFLRSFFFPLSNFQKEKLEKQYSILNIKDEHTCSPWGCFLTLAGIYSVVQIGQNNSSTTPTGSRVGDAGAASPALCLHLLCLHLTCRALMMLLHFYFRVGCCTLVEHLECCWHEWDLARGFFPDFYFQAQSCAFANSVLLH